MCICDEIGKEKIISMALRQPRPDGLIVGSFLTMRRADKWEAELRVSAKMGDEYVSENYPNPPRRETVWRREEQLICVPINYCPKCGKRLSLADAERKEKEEEDWWN